MTFNDLDMGLLVAVVVLSYLVGSVPTAYIAARLLRGMDIRERGSGQVGGSNVWHSVSRRVGVLVGLADFAKGIVSVLLARSLAVGLEGQVAAGLSAMVGHNWSVFLRFGGGRGIATMGGVLVLLAPRELAVVAGFAAAGLLLKALPVGIIIGVAILPVASVLLKEPAAVVAGSLFIVALVVAKRVVPRRKWPSGDVARVLLYRALFDRDVRSRELWIKGRAADEGPDGTGGETR